MALSETARMGLALAFLGCLAFILGIVAENKKPASGTPIPGKDVVICKFPSDPSVALGSVSVVALLFTAIVGLLAVFYPYKGKTVPKEVLFSSTPLLVFLIVAVSTTVLAEVMLLWATITEGLHHTRNVHYDLETLCPTAKTGLFGGAAFLALDAALFWLICQMLTMNARADYFCEDEDELKGHYGEVLVADYDANEATQTPLKV